MIPFVAQRTGDRVADSIEDRLATSIRSIQELPILGLRLVQSVSFTSGSVANVQHGLGRAPITWWVGAIDQPGRIFAATDQRNPSLYLSLLADFTGDADILVV